MITFLLPCSCPTLAGVVNLIQTEIGQTKQFIFNKSEINNSRLFCPSFKSPPALTLQHPTFSKKISLQMNAHWRKAQSTSPWTQFWLSISTNAAKLSFTIRHHTWNVLKFYYFPASLHRKPSLCFQNPISHAIWTCRHLSGCCEFL